MKRTYIIETEWTARELRGLATMQVLPLPRAEEKLLASLRCDPKARARFAESPRMLERLVAAVRGESHA